MFTCLLIAFGSLFKRPLPGHPLTLQAWECKLFPWQSTPPFLGGGLVQARERLWTPPPHVTLQLSQIPQFDQPPLTVKTLEGVYNFIRNAQAITYTKRVKINVSTCLSTAMVQSWVKHKVPGHPMVLQNVDRELGPWQSTPPIAGGGLVQVRVRVCIPLPQVRLQPPQGFQLDHPPLTMEEMNLKIKIKLNPLWGLLDFKCTRL